MRTFARSLRRVAFAAASLAALAAQAGGPLSICNGQPVKYPGAGTVTLNYDGGAGGLGPLTKAQADAIVTSAVSLWTNVNTATVTLARGADLPVDVTVANYTTYLNSFSDGLNPIIYDTDGSIVDDLLGVGSKNSVLGFAGSAYNGATCSYVEGRGVISGYLLSQGLPQIQINVAFAHEVGHLIGMDHSQLDTAQGLASNNTPLMYPIAQRGTLTLGDDDISAVTALYPDTNVNTVYGQISGNFTLANGVTPLPGANIWAREQTSGKAYSVVSDYLTQGTGFFKMLLPAGTYTLHAEAIQSRFDGGSSVGPYSETYPTDPSFLSPLYVGGAPMAPVTLGNSVPTQFSINPGCAATVTFTLAGTGTIGGNCTTKATPSITVGSSANPSNVGTDNVFTAVISGNAGTPTGTFVFRDGTTNLAACNNVAISSGHAVCTIAGGLAAGTHAITALYSGDVNYIALSSGTLPQTVNGVVTPPLATPSITVGSSANPAASGVTVVITAVLSGSAGTPTGTVFFRDGSTTLAACNNVAVSSGRANCTLTSLAVGTHPITAVYSGDVNYTGIGSGTLPQTITGVTPPTPVTPSITVGSSQNPAPSGTSVVIVAVLSGSNGTPTGTVLFRDNGTTVAGCSAVAMSGGRANCTMSGLSVGTHPITAAYSGDAAYLAINSSTLPQSITGVTPPTPVTPSITVGSSQNPAPSGTSVVIVAVLSGSYGTPTGTVLFRDNGTTVAGCSAVALSAGRANCTMNGLSVGTHPITAVYSGDVNYTGVGSGTLPQSITGVIAPTPVTPSITVGSSQNPAPSGTSVVIVAVLSGSNGTPTGTVLFRDNGTTVAGCSAVAMSGGRANCTMSGLSVGTHPITAAYSGDAAYLAINSSTLPQSITGTSTPTPVTPSMTVGSSQNPAPSGTSVVITAVLSGSAGTPTGTVLFHDGTTTVAGCSAVVMAAGRANCTMSGLSVGTHPITAIYSGDASYLAISSGTLPQSINATATPTPITPSITVGSSQNPAPSGTSVDIIAVLSGSNGTPTGTVLFRDNGTTIAGCSAVAMSAGRATCTMTALAVGTHPITATYSGDSAYTPLDSSTLPQSITGGTTPAPTTPSITVGSSANPSLLNAPVTIVAAISGGNGTPTGTVMFQDGGATIASCSGVALSGGRANCTLNGLAPGLHLITALYSGDGNYFSLASSTLPQTVSNTVAPPQATPSITAGSSQNPAPVGTTVTLVAVISGAVGTPTGTFQFRDGSTTIPGCSAVVLSAGRANCTVAGFTLGLHPITALYSGDSAYLPLSSSTLPQTMN